MGNLDENLVQDKLRIALENRADPQLMIFYDKEGAKYYLRQTEIPKYDDEGERTTSLCFVLSTESVVLFNDNDEISEGFGVNYRMWELDGTELEEIPEGVRQVRVAKEKPSKEKKKDEKKKDEPDNTNPNDANPDANPNLDDLAV